MALLDGPVDGPASRRTGPQGTAGTAGNPDHGFSEVFTQRRAHTKPEVSRGLVNEVLSQARHGDGTLGYGV